MLDLACSERPERSVPISPMIAANESHSAGAALFVVTSIK